MDALRLGERDTSQEPQNWVESHNAEPRAVWEAFYAGKPTRPPVALGTDARFSIFNEELNPGALTF